jgi:hypothetical protein
VAITLKEYAAGRPKMTHQLGDSLKNPQLLFSRFVNSPAATASRPSRPPAAPPVQSIPAATATPPRKDLIQMGAVSQSSAGKALSWPFLEQAQTQAPKQATPQTAGSGPFPKISFQKPVQLREGVQMYMPQNPVKADGRVDLIIQFRGDVPQRYGEGGVNAVVVSAETAGLSAAMMEKFGQSSFVPQIMETVLAKLRKQYGPEVQLGRLAMGSFSAGYAPLQVALSNPAVAARTDAVIVLDGIHYGGAGKPNPAAHAPFVDFAKAASQSQKLMVISHSAIKPTYSSSTDAADYILKQAGASRQSSTAAPAAWQYSNRYGEKIAPSTRADRGDFHVEGYAGNVARSHVEQIDQLGNLWNQYLAPRWQ